METANVSWRNARVRGWAGNEGFFLYLSFLISREQTFLFQFVQLTSLWRGSDFRSARPRSDRLKFAAGQVREAGNDLATN